MEAGAHWRRVLEQGLFVLVVASLAERTSCWLTCHPDSLTEDDRPRLGALLERCPELQAASDQVRTFAAMMAQLTGQHLPQWISHARDAGLPGISSFARGLEQDLYAITQGLTTRGTPAPSTTSK
jgi:transposase